MARRATGTVLTVELADGTRLPAALPRRRPAPRVILHERRGCACGCGGGWNERSARIELGNILARVRAGVWTSRPPAGDHARGRPGCRPSTSTRRVAAGEERDGVLGDTPIDAEHLLRLPLAARVTCCRSSPPTALDEIDRELCLAFKAHKLREAAELRARDRRRRRPARPPRPRSRPARRRVDPQAHRHARRDPRRGRRGRAHRPQPGAQQAHARPRAQALAHLPGDGRARRARSTPPAARTDSQQHASRPVGARHAPPGRSPRVLSAGMRPAQIAAELGLAKSTVSYHLARLGRRAGRDYLGRGAIVEILGRSGVRVSELCDLRIGHVRLHDPDGARFHIPDAKTQAGIREVQMTPDSQRRSSRTSTACAAPATRRSPTLPVPEPPRRTHQPPARRAIVPSRRRRLHRAPRRGACRRCRPPRRTRCAGPTSRSRCSPTASTSSGS